MKNHIRIQRKQKEHIHAGTQCTHTNMHAGAYTYTNMHIHALGCKHTCTHTTTHSQL